MDRCYTYRGVHIPGCMGCAVHGHSHCTCEPVSAKVRHPLDDARKHIIRIEQELVRLRKAVEAIASAYKEPTPVSGQEEGEK